MIKLKNMIFVWAAGLLLLAGSLLADPGDVRAIRVITQSVIPSGTTLTLTGQLEASGTVAVSATRPGQTVSASNVYASGVVSATTLNATTANVGTLNAGTISGGAVARAFGRVDSAGNLYPNSLNVGSTSRPSGGIYEVTFATPMNTDNYAVILTKESGAGCNQTAYVTSRSNTGFQMASMVICGSGSGFSDNAFSFTVFENR